MTAKALPNRKLEIFLGRLTKLMIRVKTQAQGIWPTKESSHQGGRLTPARFNANGANDLN